MKTLSIQQPWASLVCAGIKDVSHCAWHSVMISVANTHPHMLLKP